MDLQTALQSIIRPQAPKPRREFSRDMLGDYEQQYGGLDALTTATQSARGGEAGADPHLSGLPNEDLAALDRYTNFAKMVGDARGSEPGIMSNIGAGLQGAGGLGLMAATEALKVSPELQDLASTLYSKATDAEPGFFGGASTSKPNMGNLTSALYGIMRGFQ